MRKIVMGLVVLSLLAVSGCGGMGPTKFVHPEYDFSFLETVAVIPFENLSTDPNGGARATRYFATALLASEAFSVVEPGEVTRATERLGLVMAGQMAQDQAVVLGGSLNAQGLFLGTLSESTTLRAGSSTVQVVTVTVRLVETETGATVWASTHTEDSATFWSSLFGTKQKGSAEVTRRAIDKVLDTLLD
jgi:TolB-like protein